MRITQSASINPPGPSANEAIFIVKVRCQNRPGIIHQLTKTVLELKGDILEFDQFTLNEEEFMCRIEFVTGAQYTVSDVEGYFNEFIQDLKASLTVINAQKKLRMGLMVSNHTHCMAELLYQFSVALFVSFLCQLRCVFI